MNNLIDGLLVDVYAYLLPELGHAAASSQFVRAADCAGRMRIAETYAELKGLLGVVGSCCLPMVRAGAGWCWCCVCFVSLCCGKFRESERSNRPRRSVCILALANRVKASDHDHDIVAVRASPPCSARLDHLAARAQVHQRA